MDSTGHKTTKINLITNLIMGTYLVLLVVMDFIFEPMDNEPCKKTLWDKIVGYNDVFAGLGAVIFVAGALLGAVFVVKLFWNRMISNLVEIREITFYEALSIVLLMLTFRLFLS